MQCRGCLTLRFPQRRFWIEQLIWEVTPRVYAEEGERERVKGEKVTRKHQWTGYHCGYLDLNPAGDSPRDSIEQCYSNCGHRTEKGQFSFQSQRRAVPKNVNWELPHVQSGFRKVRGTRHQIANFCWIMGKTRGFQKNIYFCFIDYP